MYSAWLDMTGLIHWLMIEFLWVEYLLLVLKWHSFILWRKPTYRSTNFAWWYCRTYRFSKGFKSGDDAGHSHLVPFQKKKSLSGLLLSSQHVMDNCINITFCLNARSVLKHRTKLFFRNSIQELAVSFTPSGTLEGPTSTLPIIPCPKHHTTTPLLTSPMLSLRGQGLSFLIQPLLDLSGSIKRTQHSLEVHLLVFLGPLHMLQLGDWPSLKLLHIFQGGWVSCNLVDTLLAPALSNLFCC